MSSKWKFIFFNVFRLKYIDVFSLLSLIADYKWRSKILQIHCVHSSSAFFFESFFKHISVSTQPSAQYTTMIVIVVIGIIVERLSWSVQFFSSSFSVTFNYSDSVFFLSLSLSLVFSYFFLKVRNNASVCQLKLKYTSLSLSLSSFFIQDFRRQRKMASAGFVFISKSRAHCLPLWLILLKNRSFFELNINISQCHHSTRSIQKVSVHIYISLIWVWFYFVLHILLRLLRFFFYFIECRYNDWIAISTFATVVTHHSGWGEAASVIEYRSARFLSH